MKPSGESLSVIAEASEAQAVHVSSFLKIVKKYTEPAALTPQLLHEFVVKIVVRETGKSSGHRIQVFLLKLIHNHSTFYRFVCNTIAQAATHEPRPADGLLLLGLPSFCA